MLYMMQASAVAQARKYLETIDFMLDGNKAYNDVYKRTFTTIFYKYYFYKYYFEVELDPRRNIFRKSRVILTHRDEITIVIRESYSYIRNKSEIHTTEDERLEGKRKFKRRKLEKGEAEEKKDRIFEDPRYSSIISILCYRYNHSRAMY